MTEPERFRLVISTLDVVKMNKVLSDEEDESHRDGADPSQEKDSLDKTKFKTVRKALKYLLEAAQQGYVEAHTELGQAFEVAGDHESAKTW